MCQEVEDRDRLGVCGRVRVHLGARACTWRQAVERLDL
jgi:hypothetical protein